MTFPELIEKEIRNAGRALSIGEALSLAKEDGSFDELQKVGLTPYKTVYSLLHKDIAKGEKSRFVQVSSRPATFDLRNR